MTDVCNAVVKDGKVPEDWLEQELDGECLQRKGWCTDMWLIQGHKAVGACNEGLGKSDWREIETDDDDGDDDDSPIYPQH